MSYTRYVIDIPKEERIKIKVGVFEKTEDCPAFAVLRIDYERQHIEFSVEGKNAKDALDKIGNLITQQKLALLEAYDLSGGKQ